MGFGGWGRDVISVYSASMPAELWNQQFAFGLNRFQLNGQNLNISINVNMESFPLNFGLIQVSFVIGSSNNYKPMFSPGIHELGQPVYVRFTGQNHVKHYPMISGKVKMDMNLRLIRIFHWEAE